MVTPVSSIGQPDSQVNQASSGGMISRITQAIKQASARTGVDFSYLMNKASQESSFDPTAKASTSSATGLFQFTQQTWLQMVKEHGDQYGLGQYADHIQVANGVAKVSDPNWRQAILSMRNDPTVSAEMAGELDKQNYGALKADVGGKIGPTELYLAHFLGAGGASDFLNIMKTNPNANAAEVLPDAAAANTSVFYDKTGAAKSVSQIYKQFAQKFNRAPDVPKADETMVADTASASSLSATAIHAYAVADSGFAAHVSSYTPPVMSSNAKAVGSSLYATMALAQMSDLQNSSMAVLGGDINVNHKKDPTISLLANVA